MSEQSASDLQHQVIPRLQEIQERFGYIPQQAVEWLSSKLRLSPQEIYGVATFYNYFRFNPPGKHEIRVCLGTACHVGGGEKLLDALSEKLSIQPGETTTDERYNLERVACVGACALAPNIVMDDEVHGRMTQRSLKRLLDKTDREDKKATTDSDE
ncbi:MAG: NADH-quinone oxidoreductase subunit NuoE [Promethearchaeota archaeon]